MMIMVIPKSGPTKLSTNIYDGENNPPQACNVPYAPVVLANSQNITNAIRSHAGYAYTVVVSALNATAAASGSYVFYAFDTTPSTDFVPIPTSTTSNFNSATTSALNSATTTALNSATTSVALNSATTSALNSATTTTALNSATTSALNSVTTTALNSATTTALNSATTSAINSATTSALYATTSSTHSVVTSTTNAINAVTTSALNSATTSAYNTATTGVFVWPSTTTAGNGDPYQNVLNFNPSGAGKPMFVFSGNTNYSSTSMSPPFLPSNGPCASAFAYGKYSASQVFSPPVSGAYRVSASGVGSFNSFTVFIYNKTRTYDACEGIYAGLRNEVTPSYYSNDDVVYFTAGVSYTFVIADAAFFNPGTGAFVLHVYGTHFSDYVGNSIWYMPFYQNTPNDCYAFQYNATATTQTFRYAGPSPMAYDILGGMLATPTTGTVFDGTSIAIFEGVPKTSNTGAKLFYACDYFYNPGKDNATFLASAYTNSNFRSTSILNVLLVPGKIYTVMIGRQTTYMDQRYSLSFTPTVVRSLGSDQSWQMPSRNGQGNCITPYIDTYIYDKAPLIRTYSAANLLVAVYPLSASLTGLSTNVYKGNNAAPDSCPLQSTATLMIPDYRKQVYYHRLIYYLFYVSCFLLFYLFLFILFIIMYSLCLCLHRPMARLTTQLLCLRSPNLRPSTPSTPSSC
eukprot:TRINITY_DN1651_c1_g2_i2.p1 TRINITY_DN1651_c1_g2~~TRINITY_DN1651_c1_g2_i2.p1  ORF type:complete len:687 (-),score=139.89 TRINITY_DN1651_c1_g2_i2:549-2609(-)